VHSRSLFSLAQMMFMIPWGRTADRFGRKPVLVFSLVGVSIMTSLFGFSKSIPAMILFRCLSGALSANVLTVRTMISENCSLKTQARAFSLFSFAGSFGIFIGPVIGMHSTTLVCITQLTLLPRWCTFHSSHAVPTCLWRHLDI
jgi:MFS family permease